MSSLNVASSTLVGASSFVADGGGVRRRRVVPPPDESGGRWRSRGGAGMHRRLLLDTTRPFARMNRMKESN